MNFCAKIGCKFLGVCLGMWIEWIMKCFDTINLCANNPFAHTSHNVRKSPRLILRARFAGACSGASVRAPFSSWEACSYVQARHVEPLSVCGMVANDHFQGTLLLFLHASSTAGSLNYRPLNGQLRLSRASSRGQLSLFECPKASGTFARESCRTQGG